MTIGLKRGTVKLCPHDPEWEDEAQKTIVFLAPLFGAAAVDIQHVGSTSVRGIRAKPILDIAVAAPDMEAVRERIPVLEAAGVRFRGEDHPGQLLFVMGDFENEIRTHHIHVVPADSRAWRDYLAFRDRLNARPELAAEYDRLKGELAERYAADRGSYTAGKAAFIARILGETEPSSETP